MIVNTNEGYLNNSCARSSESNIEMMVADSQIEEVVSNKNDNKTDENIADPDKKMSNQDKIETAIVDISSVDDEKRGIFRRTWERIRPSILCPAASTSRPVLGALNFILIVLVVLLALGAMISLLGSSATPPRGPIFQLALLYLTATAAGPLIQLLNLPPLLGMLIAGIVLRNIGVFIMEGSYLTVVATLRLCAMVVILIKAGLGLDGGALRRLSCIVLRLAFSPCLAEAVTAMLASHLLLGMPWIWGALLGCVLAAVSPAVVVPSLLGLKERGYGEDKGIATLVVAASSIDDIACISAFGICLGTIFSEGSLTDQILQGPIEIAIGISFGLSFGFLVTYFPHVTHGHLKEWRAFLIGAGGIFAILGSQRIGFDGAGPLGCICAAFVASCGWKAETPDQKINVEVEQMFSSLWKIFQPVLFGLIGTEIVISQLEGSTLLLGLAIICCSITIRTITVVIITAGGVLNVKERFFVAVAWLPKATVQAALAPVALDLARKLEASDEIISLAEQVLTIGVLSILVTAPIGAIGISLLGPRMLSVPEDWGATNPATPRPSLTQGVKCNVINLLKRR